MDNHELAQRLQALEAEVAELRATTGDRLDTVETSVAESSRKARVLIEDASEQAESAKVRSKYNYQMLGVMGLLVAAVTFNFLPEKWQEAASTERVGKNLQGFIELISVLSTVIPPAGVAGAGIIAYKAHNLKQRS